MLTLISTGGTSIDQSSHEHFTSFLALGHIPEAWKISRAIFINKTEKTSHEGAKDYRSISLTFFVLKPIEV